MKKDKGKIIDDVLQKLNTDLKDINLGDKASFTKNSLKVNFDKYSELVDLMIMIDPKKN